MDFIWVWFISVIATMYLADQKKLGVVGYFFFALLTGPVALIVALLMPKRRVVSEPVQEVATLEEAKRQLKALQNSLLTQEQRIKNLENLINQLSGVSLETPKVEEHKPYTPTVDMPKPMEVQEIVKSKHSDMELDFGRNWLNKIGIIVLALGIAFLISYTFKYFGPVIKIAFGYLVAGALFFMGSKLEAKDKLMHYGRALLGGAWAIIYFTTYAMHHFESSRLIASQGVDLLLLALVVLGMMAHTLKYKSEAMMVIALSVAYLTSTIGQITSFTFFSQLFLAVVVLFLVYKLQWVRILSLGIVMTYGIHYVWVLPNLMASSHQAVFLGVHSTNDHNFLNLIFLTSYALVFLIGVHLVRTVKDDLHARTLAAANFGNVALYSILSYPLVIELFNQQRFGIVLGEGLVYLILALVMKVRGQEKIYISDLIAGIFVITFSIALKFLPSSSLMIWLVEIPCLLLIGSFFQEKTYRYLSYALTVFVAFKIVSLSCFGHLPAVEIFGFHWPWYGFICFYSMLSSAACFYLTQLLRRELRSDNIDSAFDYIFSAVAGLSLFIWIASLVHQPWSALSLSLQAWLFLIISLALGFKRFRAYAYLAFACASFVFLYDPIHLFNNLLKWAIVIGNLVTFFGAYHLIKYIKQNNLSEMFFEFESELIFVVGIILLVFAAHQYIDPPWISLSLGIASVLFILNGFIGGNKIERLGGMVLLALTLGRVVLMDLSGLDIVFKIITLIVLGVLFLGVSYVYNRFNIKKN